MLRILFIFLISGLSASSYAEWFLRGTVNNWSNTAMVQVDSHTFRSCQYFSGDHHSGQASFKVDRFANWLESYPTNNYLLTPNNSYQIDFNIQTQQITAMIVPGCFDSQLTQLNFRGTSNNWATTPLHLVANHTWEATIYFSGISQQRFKLDEFGDWSNSYGDNNNDSILDKNGTDIETSLVGFYKISVNDQSLQYSFTPSTGTLGAEYFIDKTVFSIWSPESNLVTLSLDGQIYSVPKITNFNQYTDIYQIEIPGNWHLKPYEFYINGLSVRDPYGKMVIPNTNTNIVLDMNNTQLQSSGAPTPSLLEREDAIIYEVHIRDFTIHNSSGVNSSDRGKYTGMTQQGTQYQGVSTGIDHLKELGITHVQLMPIYDFATCSDLQDQECYNWGYDPRNYNIPEERYSKTPYDYINRVKEFKQMIDNFHQAGIRVIMDVVYNHTYADEMFADISPQYFYEQNLVVGNTIDANQPMVRRMIQDSLEYWVKEYNIDGFRFDLIGVFDYDDVEVWANHINNTFPERNILMYGEPWLGCFGCIDNRESYRLRLGTVGRIHESHFGVFNPKFREAIKGQNDSGHCAPGDCYALNEGDLWPINVGSRGALRFTQNKETILDSWDPMFAMDPEQSINYVSAHDNLSLRDKIIAWADLKGISHSDDYLRRVQQFANGIILTSQGIPFLHGGVEMMRHKQGEHNSYNLPDAVNQYLWQWKVDNADIFNYYRDIIALRKAHPALRLNTWNEINNHVVTTEPRYGVVVHHIQNKANNDPWSNILIIYNSADNYQHVLPSGNWYVALEQSNPQAGNDRLVTGAFTAEGSAVSLLYQP